MKLEDILKNKLIFTVDVIAQDKELVKEIQTRLAELGWYPWTMVDGVWGKVTSNCVSQFCDASHLDNAKTGKFGSSFANALLSAKALPKNPIIKQDHIRLILAECRKQNVRTLSELAYVLGTVQHETDGKFQPIDEYGGAHKHYAPYWGRGYVQLTWLTNYQIYSRLTGKNLVDNPHLAKEPYTAAFILVHGFRTGAFTGKKLSDYVSHNQCDFRNARRCINGMDCADLIAGYAHQWVKRLQTDSSLADLLS